MEKIVIAIDPDVDKSGVCYYNVTEGKVESSSLAFPELLDYLKFISEKKIDDSVVKVVIEAGWLNKSHWHGAYSKNTRIAATIGNATGRNHEIGRKLVECAKHYGLDVIEQKPFVKKWNGADGKITQKELDMVMKGFKLPAIIGRTNQDMRDAALIAVVYGNRCI